MALLSEEEQDARDFNQRLRRMIARHDGLVYEIDADVKSPNVISPSTIGDKIAWFTVKFYNVGDPETVFTPRQLMKLGEMGADVAFEGAGYRTDYHSNITITKRFRA